MHSAMVNYRFGSILDSQSCNILHWLHHWWIKRFIALDYMGRFWPWINRNSASFGTSWFNKTRPKRTCTPRTSKDCLWTKDCYNVPCASSPPRWSICSSLSCCACQRHCPFSDEAQTSLRACTTCYQHSNVMSWLQHREHVQGTRTTRSIALRRVISVRKVAACGGIFRTCKTESGFSSWRNDGFRQLSLDKGSTRLREVKVGDYFFGVAPSRRLSRGEGSQKFNWIRRFSKYTVIHSFFLSGNFMWLISLFLLCCFASCYCPMRHDDTFG